MRVTQILRSGGGKIRYPKHVWSPAGGWYTQPSNWKTNTAVCMTVVGVIVLAVGTLSAENEHREKMPRSDRFYPSRWWSKEVVEHQKGQKTITETVAQKVSEITS